MTSRIAPICLWCNRARDLDEKPACDAFPAGIPDVVWSARSDHVTEVKGDGGLRFSPSMAPPPGRPLRALREAGDDHFYGAWKGGSKSEGGRPGGSADDPLTRGRPENAPPRWEAYTGAHLVTDKTPEGVRPHPDAVVYDGKRMNDGGPFSSYASPFDGYGLSPDPETRLRLAGSTAAQMDPTHAPRTWEPTRPLPTDPANRAHVLGVARGEMAGAWADSVTTPKAALVASSVQAAGLGQGMVWSQGDRLLKPSANGIEVARSMYETTQQALAAGPATITLYRGVSHPVVSRNVLESWTTDRTIASRFDGHTVLRAVVPREAVFMRPDADFGRGEAGEHVLLASRVPTSTMRRVKPRLPEGYSPGQYIGDNYR